MFSQFIPAGAHARHVSGLTALASLECGSPVPPWLHEHLQAQAGDDVAVAGVPCLSPKESKAVPGYRTPESQRS
jgi:hypothetical protein